jgi:hypothetical protein
MMTKVTILLAPNTVLREIYFTAGVRGLVEENISHYTACKPFEVNCINEDAAEEVFDLTNNPSRQEEREEKYGRGRSVSMGDIVDVEGVKWVCMSTGWEQL